MQNPDIIIEKLLKTVIQSIEDKKGNNIVSLEFTPEQSSICEYFVVCDAESERQVKAITKSVHETIQLEMKMKPTNMEGLDTANWVLLDYFDIIVHIFQRESRDFYGLEKLWADAKITNY